MIKAPVTHFAGYMRTRIFNESQLDADGNPTGAARFDSGFQCNKLLDTFFDKHLSGTGATQPNSTREHLVGYMAASTETTAPADGDTSLGASQIGTRFTYHLPSDTAVADTGAGKLIQTRQFRSTKGQVQGTVGKLAIFDAATGGTMNVASLVKDETGTATTLPLGANDYLYVDWRLETTLNLNPVTGVINIPGEGDFNYTLQPAYWTSLNTASALLGISTGGGANQAFGFARVGAYAGNLGAVTSGPAGTASFQTPTPILGAYTPGSKQRTVTYQLGEPDANLVGGIRSFMFTYSSGAGGGYQFSLSRVSDGATLNKTNTKQLNITMLWAFSR